MNRRCFLALAVAAFGSRKTFAAAREVHTVTGPVPASELGLTLMHEHVLVDFIGAGQVSPSRYAADDVVRAALPRLRQIRELGCRTLVECTPAYLGRDPRLLARLSRESGLRIVTNTGYYAAVKHKYLPAHALTETAEQLAARWIAEVRKGIEGTGIRPGFLKTSVNQAPLGELDAKIVRAAALTSRETGITIASHTGTGAAALEELAILAREGVPAGSFIWVHAQSEKDSALHREVAERGAWVEFDGIRDKTLDRHLELVGEMAKSNLLGRALVSQDSGWYRVGEPGGGEYRPYDFILTNFVPGVRERLGQAAVERLLVENPARALSGQA